MPLIPPTLPLAVLETLDLRGLDLHCDDDAALHWGAHNAAHHRLGEPSGWVDRVCDDDLNGFHVLGLRSARIVKSCSTTLQY